MSWDRTYSHNFLLALDVWAATVFFNRPGITISTMTGLVETGHDAPLKLWGWQKTLLRGIGLLLTRKHRAEALLADRSRAQFVLDNTPKELPT